MVVPDSNSSPAGKTAYSNPVTFSPEDHVKSAEVPKILDTLMSVGFGHCCVIPSKTILAYLSKASDGDGGANGSGGFTSL